MSKKISNPEKPLWGEQTEAALELFGPGPVPPSVIHALAEVKKAALFAQLELDHPFPEGYGDILLEVLNSIIAGDLDSQFPLNLEMGSAGTALHMNLNEVVCNLTNRRFKESGGQWQAHFLDHINRFQSTNDVLPTALTILLYRGLTRIEKGVVALQEALVERENRYDQILILGRTELQDALPMKAGQIFAAWAGGAERDRWRLEKLKERCRSIALGGTALGTSFSAPRDYVFLAERKLREITGLPLSRSQNLTDEVAMQDKTSEVFGGLALVADNLFKLSGDLLLYSSSFSGEFPHPELLYGSTIMAGKTNPVLLEYIRGLAVTARSAAERGREFCREGQLQLNAWLPFIFQAFLDCSGGLEKALDSLTEKLLPQLEPDRERIEAYLYGSPALIQALRPWLPYDRIKEIHYRFTQSSSRPGSREQWIRWMVEEAELEESFLEDFLDSPALTGYYRKEL